VAVVSSDFLSSLPQAVASKVSAASAAIVDETLFMFSP
jgi:hypothetical protein